MPESISRLKDYCWSSPLFSPQSANQWALANNKMELPDFSPKHTEMTHIPYSINQHSLSNKHYPHYPHDLAQNLWLNQLSLDRDITQLQLSAGAGWHNPQASPGIATPTGFSSHVFPSTIISSAPDLCASIRAPNLQALDLLTYTYHDGSFSQSSHDKLSEPTFMVHDAMPELVKNACPSNSSSKVGTFFL